jgi:hypothetical protein
VSKDYNHEIGYETLQKDWEVYKKQVPRGVTLVKGGNTIYLQFKTPNKPRSKYKCDCTFSINGMIDAVRKANRVADKLKTLDSEVEFWNWYDKEIKQESQLVDDRLTFAEAIAKVEDDFWSRPSRTKRERDKDSPSDLSSWHRTYGCFYQQLPQEKIINLEDIATIIARQKKGSRNYKYAVSAMKKLATINKRRDIYDELDSINVIQTKNAKLQTITLEDFLDWRDRTLGITASLSKSVDLNSRKAWLWVFSVQVVYGLRVSEVFAIANLDKPLMSDDGTPIPALNSLDNTDNLIFIKDKTNLGTTVKTGYRMARPLVPPKCPNLIELLNIKKPLLPANKPGTGNSETIRKFYSVKARKLLINWNAPFTQTHALRHLANINGIQAGIPQEVRAQSLGHTVQMNESVYKKRQSTQTTIDLLLNSNQNAIDFVTALGEAKKLARQNESNKEIIAQLLSIIYQKNINEILELL